MANAVRLGPVLLHLGVAVCGAPYAQVGNRTHIVGMGKSWAQGPLGSGLCPHTEGHWSQVRAADSLYSHCTLGQVYRYPSSSWPWNFFPCSLYLKFSI